MGQRRKRRLTKQGRLRLSINSLLDVLEEESEDLRYLADSLFRHFVRDEASFEAFADVVGGVRARSMLRAFRTLYPCVRKRSEWAEKIIGRLESVRFTQKIERQQRLGRASKSADGRLSSLSRK